MHMMIWMRAEDRSPSSSSSSGGEGTIELWEPDDRMPGLAVVFLLSLSVSLSKLTTSYSVSELLFLSVFSICRHRQTLISFKDRLHMLVNALFLSQNLYFECKCCLKMRKFFKMFGGKNIWFSNKSSPVKCQAPHWARPHRSELEIEALGVTAFAEGPEEPLVGWAHPNPRLQQEAHRLLHLRDHQVHRRRHVHELICGTSKRIADVQTGHHSVLILVEVMSFTIISWISSLSERKNYYILLEEELLNKNSIFILFV